MSKPVPGNCPVCALNIFQVKIVRANALVEEDGATQWWCHGCNSWFMWNEETRRVRDIETVFMHGRMGNVNIREINDGKTICRIDGKLPDKFDPPHYNHNKSFPNDEETV
jgi:hypothetical protein